MASDDPLELILACRPVDWEPFRAMLPDLPEPTIYPGSAVGHCAECATEIYIGPRAQAVPGGIALCFTCAAQRTVAEGGAFVHNLGNPYVRRKDDDG